MRKCWLVSHAYEWLVLGPAHRSVGRNARTKCHRTRVSDDEDDDDDDDHDDDGKYDDDDDG